MIAKHQQHIYELVIEDGFPKYIGLLLCISKCKQTQEWFDVAKYVKENYDFYRKHLEFYSYYPMI